MESGRVVVGATGTAAEFGHIRLQLDGILEPGQPIPRCNCGASGDVESIASLTAIEVNLLPYWLGRYPDHPLSQEPLSTAAKRVRGFGERGDEMALRLFEQQAMAIGRLFSLGANFLDADAYFVGGGVIETSADFRDWFLGRVAEHAEFATSSAPWCAWPSFQTATWPAPRCRHGRIDAGAQDVAPDDGEAKMVPSGVGISPTGPTPRHRSG